MLAVHRAGLAFGRAVACRLVVTPSPRRRFPEPLAPDVRHVTKPRPAHAASPLHAHAGAHGCRAVRRMLAAEPCARPPAPSPRRHAAAHACLHITKLLHARLRPRRRVTESSSVAREAKPRRAPRRSLGRAAARTLGPRIPTQPAATGTKVNTRTRSGHTRSSAGGMMSPEHTH